MGHILICFASKIVPDKEEKAGDKDPGQGKDEPDQEVDQPPDQLDQGEIHACVGYLPFLRLIIHIETHVVYCIRVYKI